MTTFSQLVDRVAVEITRPDMKEKLPSYLNQSIREMFEHQETRMPVYYDDQRFEERILIDSLSDLSGSFVWPLPQPTRFQNVEAIYYESIRRYVRRADPRSSLARNDFDVNDVYFWYRVGASLVFAKPGAIGSYVRASWFEYPRYLAYQVPSLRDVEYDLASDSYTVKPGAPIDAMEKATNWLLQRHTEALAEGMRAKAYKRMDDERQRTHFAQYEAARIAIQQTAANYEAIFVR